jgi:hypothetical protein
MKHKWHKEIKAWADGAEIEFQASSGNWLPTEKPDWHTNYEYRIKPQPKEPQYLYVYQGIGELVLETSNTIVSNMKPIGKIKLED